MLLVIHNYNNVFKENKYFYIAPFYKLCRFFFLIKWLVD